MRCSRTRYCRNEEEFVNMMNSMAKKLDLPNTKFSNSSGLFNENNYSTTEDIAKMSIYLINNFPKLYEYYKIKNLRGIELVALQ